MILLEDTRQQNEKHKLKHEFFRTHGIHINRTALYCGDYTLPSDQSICIDTKRNIAELIGDIQVKQMPKKEVCKSVYDICEIQGIGFDIADQIYHAICDDDNGRFTEKEIYDICFNNHISERIISDFQAFYIKRYGFFHRGLKRAQNSQIQLFILVENTDGINTIEDLSGWHNPRLDIWTNSNEMIGFWKNGRPRYKRIRKYQNAATGEWLAKSCLTMEEKYGVKFLFCRPEEAGPKILEILGVSIDEKTTKTP